MKVRKNDVDGDFFFLRGRERLRCVRSKIEDVAGFQEGDYARKRHEPTPGGDVLRNQVTCFLHRAPCGIAPALLQTWASYFFTFCTGRRLPVYSLPFAVSKLSFYRFVSTPNPSPPYANALDASPPPAKHSALCSSASCVSASNRTCAPNPKSFAKAVESPNSAIKFDSRVHRQPNAT